MPALNFKKQFAPLVESGEKKQTIRKPRKHPIQKGDTLYLYTGQRTKSCRKLGEVYCKEALPIIIDKKGVAIRYLAGKYEPKDADIFAQKDGFNDFEEMKNWFEEKYGLPFEGCLIKW